MVLCVALLIGATYTQGAHAQSFLEKLKALVGIDKDATQSLSQSDIARGLKEALQVGTQTVVSNLGKLDGFNADADIHIPLPPSLNRAKSLLAKVGLDSAGDDLELALNRAAEAATPRAKALFMQAIKDMTLNDVTAIYKGPDDAATRYFRSRMTPQLTAEIQPVIDQSLSAVGALAAYDRFIGKYQKLPFVPDIKTDLNDFVTNKTLDGIFYYVAKEEAAIRTDPVKQTTDLLKKVFKTAL